VLRASPTLEADVHTDLDTLATALYVKIDDELKARREINRWRPTVGIPPTITDAELITLSVLQPLLGHHKEVRWIRHDRKNLRHLFPYIPKKPGYNKRLRLLAPHIQHCIRLLAHDTDLWTHPVRIADSTPVECGRSRETAKRSTLAGWASYGYCASHSRYFWGLRLHLITTVHGLSVAFALTHPKTDERDVLIDLSEPEPDILSHPDGILLTVDKGYRDTHTETWLSERNVTMIRPTYKNEAPRSGRAQCHED